MTPPIEGDEVTTPDVPSSSPGANAMDVSPLPHKAPHFVSQVTLPSPTPESTPEIEDEPSRDLLSPDEPPIVPSTTFQPQSFFHLPEYVVVFNIEASVANSL